MILVDLFSGIGGFHIGLTQAGFEFEKAYYSDIEKFPCQIYDKRFGGIALGDITKVDWEGLKIDGEKTIMCGGFPCQDLSQAGKRKGLEEIDEETGEKKVTRSGLFFEIIRAVSIVRPRIFFLENVAGLLSHNGGRTMGAILGAISEVGYDCEWTTLAASETGDGLTGATAWHKRERVWIVAYAPGL